MKHGEWLSRSAPPPSVCDWLEEELELRGIDAVYTRYIISLLQRDYVEEELESSEEFPHRCHDHQPSLPIYHLSKSRHRHWKCWASEQPLVATPRRFHSHQSSYQKKLVKGKGNASIHHSWTEEGKKLEAVQCLESVALEKSGFETLIEEVCIKLKNLNLDSESPKVLTVSKPLSREFPLKENSEMYQSTFPALNGNGGKPPLGELKKLSSNENLPPVSSENKVTSGESAWWKLKKENVEKLPKNVKTGKELVFFSDPESSGSEKENQGKKVGSCRSTSPRGKSKQRCYNHTERTMERNTLRPSESAPPTFIVPKMLAPLSLVGRKSSFMSLNMFSPFTAVKNQQSQLVEMSNLPFSMLSSQNHLCSSKMNDHKGQMETEASASQETDSFYEDSDDGKDTYLVSAMTSKFNSALAAIWGSGEGDQWEKEEKTDPVLERKKSLELSFKIFSVPWSTLPKSSSCASLEEKAGDESELGLVALGSTSEPEEVASNSAIHLPQTSINFFIGSTENEKSHPWPIAKNCKETLNVNGNPNDEIHRQSIFWSQSSSSLLDLPSTSPSPGPSDSSSILSAPLEDELFGSRSNEQFTYPNGLDYCDANQKRDLLGRDFDVLDTLSFDDQSSLNVEPSIYRLWHSSMTPTIDSSEILGGYGCMAFLTGKESDIWQPAFKPASFAEHETSCEGHQEEDSKSSIWPPDPAEKVAQWISQQFIEQEWKQKESKFEMEDSEDSDCCSSRGAGNRAIFHHKGESCFVEVLPSLVGLGRFNETEVEKQAASCKPEGLSTSKLEEEDLLNSEKTHFAPIRQAPSETEGSSICDYEAVAAQLEQNNCTFLKKKESSTSTSARKIPSPSEKGDSLEEMLLLSAPLSLVDLEDCKDEEDGEEGLGNIELIRGIFQMNYRQPFGSVRDMSTSTEPMPEVSSSPISHHSLLDCSVDGTSPENSKLHVDENSMAPDLEFSIFNKIWTQEDVVPEALPFQWSKGDEDCCEDLLDHESKKNQILNCLQPALGFSLQEDISSVNLEAAKSAWGTDNWSSTLPTFLINNAGATYPIISELFSSRCPTPEMISQQADSLQAMRRELEEEEEALFRDISLISDGDETSDPRQQLSSPFSTLNPSLGLIDFVESHQDQHLEDVSDHEHFDAQHLTCEDECKRNLHLDSDSDNFPCVPLEKALYSSQLEEEWKKSSETLLSPLHVQPPHIKSPKSNKPPAVECSYLSSRPCSFYLEGNCRRSDCKFSHDLSAITCRFWEEGSCFKGITCPFLHGYLSEEALRKKYGGNITEFALESEADFPSLSASTPSTEKTGDLIVKTEVKEIKKESLSVGRILRPKKKKISSAIGNVQLNMTSTIKKGYKRSSHSISE